MNATDTECPRCHGKGLASTPTPTAANETPNATTNAAPPTQPAPGTAPGYNATPGYGSTPGYNATPGSSAVPGDQPNFLMALVGFLVPLAGLIIYLVQRDKQPLTARSAGRGAALGFGIQAVAVPCILLAAILFPVFARARENARRASCQSNLKQLNLAAFQYLQDNNGKLPDLSSAATIRAALEKYTRSQEVFKCPLGHPYQGNTQFSGARIDQITNPAQEVLFTEPAGVHLQGHNEGFADGHVKWQRDGGQQF